MTDEVSIDLGEGRGRVAGRCASHFEHVLDVFVENFRARDEIGASTCVTFEGETVLDVWGGIAERATGRAWAEDTVSLVFSSTKGIMALVANMLIDQGLLDPFQPVAEIWPEFACNGKEGATVRMVLDHTVGVPALREPVKPDGFYDWGYMCDRVAAEEAFWVPGSMQGYHGVTIGWAAGELIRRVTGKSVGANIQERLAEPLGLDLWCGLPEEVEPRVAPMIPYVPAEGELPGAMFQAALEDPGSVPGLFLLNDGGWMSGVTAANAVGATKVDERASHAAEIPAANGISNARGLAGAYRPFALGGSADGRKFVGPDTLVGMEDISAATNHNETFLCGARWSLGFMKSMDNRRQPFGSTDSAIFGRRAFGHAGAGGSIGFADPEAGMSFAYTMNYMGGTLALTDRCQLLVDAAYRAAGFRTDAPGCWIR